MKVLVSTLLSTLLAPVVFGHVRHRKLRKVSDPRQRVDGEYICISSPSMFDNSMTDFSSLKQVIETDGGTVKYKYESSVFNGLTVSNISDDSLVRDILSRRDIELCEENRIGKFDGAQKQPQSWGLDRIDQLDLPLNSEYTFTGFGTGVDIYVLDSGILSSHEDFSDREVKCFFDPTTEDGETCKDKLGHGSHTAGIAGGRNSGVAKNVNLFVAKIDTKYGPILDYVVEAFAAVIESVQIRKRPSIINLSVGFGISDALNRAVESATAAGILTVVSAGNDDFEACYQSPASSSAAFTVAAINAADQRSSYSNYGKCVDIFAPGDDIMSADSASDTAYSALSGTSMAAPHVAGVAALILEKNPNLGVEEVKAALISSSSQGKIDHWDLGWATPNSIVSTTGISEQAPLCRTGGFCVDDSDCCGNLACLPVDGTTEPVCRRRPTKAPTPAPTPRPTRRPTPVPTPKPIKQKAFCRTSGSCKKDRDCCGDLQCLTNKGESVCRFPKQQKQNKDKNKGQQAIAKTKSTNECTNCQIGAARVINDIDMSSPGFRETCFSQFGVHKDSPGSYIGICKECKNLKNVGGTLAQKAYTACSSINICQ